MCFRPAKGGDDSDEEEGVSRPKKQRKPKERKKIEKVPFNLCSALLEWFISFFVPFSGLFSHILTSSSFLAPA